MNYIIIRGSGTAGRSCKEYLFVIIKINSKSSSSSLLLLQQMVLLEETFVKLCSKMEDHLHIHHHHHEPLFESFKVNISDSFDRLISTLNPESKSLQLPWILDCFKLLPSMHGSFEKLAADLDYRWEADDSVEHYLKYSLNLLELFNSISSTLSHLGQSRIVLTHALILFQENPSSFDLDRLKPIPPETHLREFNKDGKNHSFSGKEDVISKALTMMESIGLWVAGFVLSALSGDPNPYTEMRKWSVGSEIGSLIDLDSRVKQIMLQQREIFVREVIEINESAGSLASAIDAGEEGEASCRANELGRKLEGLEVMVEEMREEVNGLFSEVMKARNGLIDCLRIDNQSLKQL